jgi:hypothetical protein
MVWCPVAPGTILITAINKKTLTPNIGSKTSALKCDYGPEIYAIPVIVSSNYIRKITLEGVPCSEREYPIDLISHAKIEVQHVFGERGIDVFIVRIVDRAD